MQRAADFVCGTLLLEVTGAYPERFLNICAANGLVFWAVEWRDSLTLRLKVARRDGGRAAELGRKAMCDVAVLGRFGLPPFLKRFRRRYALLAGLALSLLTVGVLSQFILVIEVTGNETVSSAAILQQLRQLGFGYGSYGPSVPIRELGNRLLVEMPELSWFTLHIDGVRAEVVVRERQLAPEVEDETIPADIVAEKPGLITRIDALRGTALVQAGDTVAAGDVLIRGQVDYPDGTDPSLILSSRTIRAEGVVLARTWYTLSACTPTHAAAKTYTGRTACRYALVLGEKRINIYRKAGISYSYYDKITSEHSLTLPGGLVLPAAWQVDCYSEYQLEDAAVNKDAAQALLQAQLTLRLEQALSEHGSVTAAEWSVSETDGVLTVTLRAECLEQIGVTAEVEGSQSHT